ncbi:hypothetical protein ACHAPF_005252 [Botrytis cinerea]
MGVLMERMAEASADEPRAGKVFSIILSMISMAALAICMNTKTLMQLVAFKMYRTGLDTLLFVGVSSEGLSTRLLLLEFRN